MPFCGVCTTGEVLLLLMKEIAPRTFVLHCIAFVRLWISEHSRRYGITFRQGPTRSQGEHRLVGQDHSGKWSCRTSSCKSPSNGHLDFWKPEKKWKMTARLQCEDGVLRDPIVLLLHNEHYRAISSPKDIPKSWKSATPKGVVSRGAGKSVKSFSSWLKPASVIHARQSSNQKNTSCSSTSRQSWLKPRKISKASGSKAESQATDSVPSASSHKQSDQTIGEHSSIPERRTWICPLCSVEIASVGNRAKLGWTRGSHLRDRHPNIERASVAGLKSQSQETCAVSYNLPAHAVGWSCPWCKAQLPRLAKAVRAHCTKEHPKKDIKTLKKARWQARDPVLQVRRDNANVKIATKKAIRDSKSNGHMLTSVKVDWSAWPHKTARNRDSLGRRRPVTKRNPNASWLTCATCWRSGFLNAIVKSPCTKKMPEWHKLCALGNTNPAAIAKAWNTPVEHINSICSCWTHAQRRCWAQSRPQMPKQAYLPDLLLWNLNVRSSSAAWEILNLVSLHNIHVATLQEVRLSSNDYTAFARYAYSLGYCTHYVAGPATTDRWSNNRTNGGVLTLIKRSIKQAQNVTVSSPGGQAVQCGLMALCASTSTLLTTKNNTSFKRTLY